METNYTDVETIGTLSPETEFSLVYDTWPLPAPGMETNYYGVETIATLSSENEFSLVYETWPLPAPGMDTTYYDVETIATFSPETKLFLVNDDGPLHNSTRGANSRKQPWDTVIMNLITQTYILCD